MTREETRALWAARVAAQGASGRSAAEWCFQQDISLPSFYQWRTRLAAPAPAADGPRWVRVAEPLPAAVSLTVQVGALTLTAPVGCDPAWLAAVLRAVGA